ncbi:MAG: tetratricopeptide repeat protein [Verrucomicrobiota bacterium]
MKPLLIVAFAALLSLPAALRAEGPDDKYIEIYRLIQEGDHLAGTGQESFALERYKTAQSELKMLQTAYPNWNQQLVDYRLRSLETKLAAATQSTTPATPTSASPTSAFPTPAAPATPPAQTTAVPATAPAALLPRAGTPGLMPAPAQPEADDRDNQIKSLRQQLDRLQNDRAVLEAKLREALAAQPAAIDPRELAKAEERIRSLEKDKEVLRVSLDVAELKVARQNDTASAGLKKQLADAKEELAQQSNTITALRQEKDVLQQHLQDAKRSEEEALRTLRQENEILKQQLAARPAATEGPKTTQPLESELATTKAALQSSRETMNSLQSRVRTLQEERDQLEKTRKDLETRLAARPVPAAANSEDTGKLRQVEKERDDLQKKLAEANKQLAAKEAKAKSPSKGAAPVNEEVYGLRARLDALEARKVPYSPEELALFKKPEEPMALVAAVNAPMQTAAASATETSPAAAAAPAPPAPATTVASSADLAALLADAQRAFSARRFDEAEKKYVEALRADEKNVTTLQRLAAAQLEQSRPKDAEASLKRALDENPKDARTLLLMGIAKFDQDKFDEAFDNLSRSAQADPQNPETQNYLGITLSQKGQRAAAETALRKAIQLSPSYASAHYNLAVVYATQQPPFIELARWHYQKALAFGHQPNPEVEKMLDKKQAASQK